MYTAIRKQVESVHQSLTRLVVGRAVTMWLAVMLAVAALLCVVDFGFDLRDSGLRWLLTIVFVAAGVASGCLFVLPALAYKPTEVQVARWIESVHPELSTRLSSSLEFLAREKQGQSSSLQQRIITETEHRLQQIDVSRSISIKPFLQAFAACAVVMSFWLLFSVSSPSTARASVSRLLMPWTETRWPSENRLVLVGSVSTAARGSDLLVVVRDENDALPDDIAIELKYSGVPAHPKVPMRQPMVRRGDQAELLISNLQQDIHIRAVGGDDTSMLWHAIAVVDAPSVTELHCTTTPPGYAKSVAKEVVSGATVVAGTTLVVRGTADRPIESAWLHLSSDRDGDDSVRLSIDDSGGRFYLTQDQAVVLNTNVRFAIELFGVDGVSSGHVENRELIVVPDAPPIVQIIEPPDGHLVGPNTILTIKAEVQDDLGLAAATLSVYELNGGELFTLPIEDVQKNDTGVSVLAFSLDAAMLCSLSSEREFEYFVSVTDLIDQTANSRPLTIRVVPENELLDLVAAALLRVQEHVLAVRDDEQSVADRLTALMESGSTIEVRSNQAALSRLEIEQQSIFTRLADDAGSVFESLSEIQSLIENNRLSLGQLNDSIGSWLTTIGLLRDAELLRIRHAFKQFAITQQTTRVSALRDDLDRVVKALTEIYGECLAQSEQQSFAEAVRSIVEEQIEVRRVTLELTEHMFHGDMDPVDIRSTRDDQRAIADRFDLLLASVDRKDWSVLHRSLSDPLIADSMHAAATLIAQERLIKAAGVQRELIHAIQNALGRDDDVTDPNASSGGSGEPFQTLRALRERQIEAISTASDLATDVSQAKPLSRSYRIAVDKLRQLEDSIAGDLHALASHVEATAAATLLEHAAKLANAASLSIGTNGPGGDAQAAMSSVVETIDIMLNSTNESPPRDETGASADAERRSSLSVAIAIQKAVNSRTLAVQQEIAATGSTAATERELRELSDLEQAVLDIVSDLEFPEVEGNGR